MNNWPIMAARPACATKGCSRARSPVRSIWPSYAAPDVAELAALYALGLARNHPFIDGIKRTGLWRLETFLALNGIDLRGRRR